MATPTLKAVPVTGPAPSYAEPVEIYDLPSGEGGATDWADITGVPAPLTAAQAAGTPSIRAIGTTATTAAAGNHTHAATAVTVAAIPNLPGANVQLALADLAARVKAREDAAGA